MTTPAQPSLREASRNMSDTSDSETPEFTEPVPLTTEPARSAEQQEPATVPETTEHTQPSAMKYSQQPATTTTPEPTATTTTQKISISTNTAIGLLGALLAALITIFGGVIIALLAHTLNTTTNQFNATTNQFSILNNDIKALDTKLSAEIDALDTRIDALDTKLSTEIDALDTKLSTKIDALAQQQADTDETLSVLLAVLNARNEVEAAKAHEITGATLP